MTTKQPNVYEQLTQNTEVLAQGWSTDESELSSEPGSRDAYNEFALRALEGAVEMGSVKLQRFQKMFAEHGASLFARYLYLVSKKSAAYELGADEYESVARNDETVAQLLQIAELENDSALELELVAGLLEPAQVDVDELVGNNSVISESGAFRLFGLEDELPYALEGAKAGAGCPLHKIEQLEPMYHSFVTITLKDPSLATAVLGLQHNISTNS